MARRAKVKAVNLPFEATVADVDEIYRMAYETGCKGITVFRDRSRKRQVLVRSAEVDKEIETLNGACSRPEVCARF